MTLCYFSPLSEPFSENQQGENSLTAKVIYYSVYTYMWNTYYIAWVGCHNFSLMLSAL